MKRKHYINTTNGIEWLPNVKFTGEPFGFTRICSTTLEGNNWIKLFQELDHDLLMHLALGWECLVYDCGTRRKNSKTIYKGIPLIYYVLTRFWYGKEPIAYRLGRNSNDVQVDCLEHYRHIYDFLFTYDDNQVKTALKVKLRYYKKYLNENGFVELKGVSKSTDKDGDYVYYSNLLKNEY